VTTVCHRIEGGPSSTFELDVRQTRQCIIVTGVDDFGTKEVLPPPATEEQLIENTVEYFEYKDKISDNDIHHKAYMKRKETAKGITLGQLYSDIVLNISDRGMVRILEKDTSADPELQINVVKH
jgi:hypothetical protein